MVKLSYYLAFILVETFVGILKGSLESFKGP